MNISIPPFFLKCLSCFKNKDIEELKKDVEYLKKNKKVQNITNPLHDVSKELGDIDKKLEDQNTDVLTKIVYLKEEIQRLDSKIRELEVTLNSSDHYCIIDNRLGGSTSDDSNSDQEIEKMSKEDKI